MYVLVYVVKLRATYVTKGGRTGTSLLLFHAPLLEIMGRGIAFGIEHAY